MLILLTSITRSDLRGGCFGGCKTLDPPPIRSPVQSDEADFGNFCLKMCIFTDDDSKESKQKLNSTDLGGSKLSWKN